MTNRPIDSSLGPSEKTSVAEILQTLESIAPLSLAESWDNVGLLLGCRTQAVQRLMTCLTVSQRTVDEAIDEGADLVISHHPIPFRPLNRITTDEPTGRWLWRLASHGISVYSPHTAWDNAPEGINQQLAQLLDLIEVEPLTNPKEIGGLVLGSGRVGKWLHPTCVDDWVHLLRQALGELSVQVVGRQAIVHKLAIVCGSGGSLLKEAAQKGCNGFLTGEATYHQALEAEHLGMTLIQVGHHASERFAMDRLAKKLQGIFPNLQCWASQSEADPWGPLSTVQ